MKGHCRCLIRPVAAWAVAWGVSLPAFAQTAPPPPTQTPTPAPGNALTLSAAVTQALNANPLASSSRYQIVQAQERLAQAQAQQRWQITWTSSGGISNADIIQGPPDHQTFGELVNTVSVPLPLGPKAHLSVAQAQQQVAVAQAQFDSARLGLVAQVNAAYFDLLRKQALLALAQETQVSAVRQLTEAEKRFKAGDVAELDVLRARVPVATGEASVVQAENAVAVARQTINGLLGASLDAPVSAAEVEPFAPETKLPITLDEARVQAKTNNPDVRAAVASVRAAEFAVQLARRNRDPIYSLQASDTRSNDKTGFSRLDSLQATITLPLSDGGLARAQIKEADAALAQARAQQIAAERSALTAVSAAYRNAEASLRQIAGTRIAQEIAQIAYDKSLRGYQNGLYPLTDVLNARSALTQARIAQIQAVYDAAEANAALNNALGVLPK